MGPRNPRIAKTKYHEPVRTVTERTVRCLRFAAIVLAVTDRVSRRAVSGWCTIRMRLHRHAVCPLGDIARDER